MKIPALITATLLTLSFASTGFAGTKHMEGDETTHAGKSEMHHGSESGSVMGEHDMSGTISHINHKTGMMGVKTGMGNLQVHFPPAAIKHLKDGEKITLHLGFSKGGDKKM